jgi:hypothetical protein
MNVRLHAPGARLHRHNRPHDLFAAPIAKCLARLHRRAAPITEHDVPPPVEQLLVSTPVQQSNPADHSNNIYAILKQEFHLSFNASTMFRTPRRFKFLTLPNEKAARQQGSLLFFKGE